MPRRLALWFVVTTASAFVSGCVAHRESADPGVRVAWTLTPQPPVVGPAELAVTLTAPDGSRVERATVRLEGHMSHAGMAPVIAEGTESQPGVHLIPFSFTMAGDWVLLVSIAHGDGVRTQQRIDVRGVRAAS